MDESTDEKKERVFCVGALLADEETLRKMENAWLERLRIPDDIPYFRASCVKGVHGPFFKLRKKYGPTTAQSVASKIRADLETLLLAYPWRGFGIGIVIPDYQEVWNTIPAAKWFFQEDSVEAAFHSMFLEIARAIRKNAPTHQVAYIIDDSTYSGKIAEVFKAVKINYPVIAKSIASFAPMDDKITTPLQMADLIANIIKDIFLYWLKDGKPRYVPLEEKWRGHFELVGRWDKIYMLRNIVKTLKSKRFRSGKIALRSTPKPPGRDLKRERKRTRRALVKRLQGGQE
jgi:hypothetical protein